MLPILISIVPTAIFGIISIALSLKEEKTQKLLKQKEIQYKQHLYETTILREIQDRIGYSLDTEKVTDVITGSLDNLFPYSTVSSMIIKNDKIIFKTHIRENISHSFLAQLKQSMTNSLSALLNESLPTFIDENITGVPVDDTSTGTFASFFHIPLIVNDKIVGLISIASVQPKLYNEPEMTILYKITNVASNALSRLQDVLNIEKGKILSMITSLDDGVFMVDINSQITVINTAAKEFLNINKDQPSIIDVLSSLPNTYNFGEKIEQSILKNQKIEEKEIELNDKTLQIIITPVVENTHTATPRVIGAAVLLHDISLEKSLAKMKEDFTNIIVHELRSPLTAIKASTELLITQQDLKEEDHKKLLKLIHNSSNKMLDEVALILDAAKMEAGLFTLNKTKADLKKLIEEKVEIFQSEAQNKKIALRTDFDTNIPMFDFDQIHLGQVINNLLSNSLKFTPAGGVITISTHLLTDKVQITVTDTGIGIAKDKQSQLFSKFVQLQKPNATIGTGLGLYIVKGIAEAHGGDVKLESESGKGTSITVTIPMNATQTIISTSPSAQKQSIHLSN
jgi:signal transduction histidine kinase